MASTTTPQSAPTPVTIITGFLGSGKTTLILNLIPQLPQTYKLALLKNEFGDVAVDSQLAGSASISGVRELLNGCICCNLVGQLGEALFTLRDQVAPSRIIIETSGSAFPATLAMEVNRIARETPGPPPFTLDGVISVIDVENWKGYEDTSYTAKLQAKYTDLIVFNKWELVDERKFDDALDRLGDLDLDVQVAWVKSDRGWVDVDVIMGIDGAMVREQGLRGAIELHDSQHDHENDHDHDHSHGNNQQQHQHHQDEVEVLSVTLHHTDPDPDPSRPSPGIARQAFEDLLLSAPKDEVYRIKGLVLSSTPPPDSTGDVPRKPGIDLGNGDGNGDGNGNDNGIAGDSSSNSTNVSEGHSHSHSPIGLYVLNWAFGRWTYTLLPNSNSASALKAMDKASARLTFILARGESTKWIRRLEKGDFVALEGDDDNNRKGVLKIEKIG